METRKKTLDYDEPRRDPVGDNSEYIKYHPDAEVDADRAEVMARASKSIEEAAARAGKSALAAVSSEGREEREYERDSLLREAKGEAERAAALYDENLEERGATRQSIIAEQYADAREQEVL